MNYIIKKINLNLDYSYLIIGKKTILDDQYENIREIISKDFEGIK